MKPLFLKRSDLRGFRRRGGSPLSGFPRSHLFLVSDLALLSGRHDRGKQGGGRAGATAEPGRLPEDCPGLRHGGHLHLDADAPHRYRNRPPDQGATSPARSPFLPVPTPPFFPEETLCGPPAAPSISSAAANSTTPSRNSPRARPGRRWPASAFCGRSDPPYRATAPS